MIILALDLETTGLDQEKDAVVEVGAVIWDTTKNRILKIYSEFVKEYDRPVFQTEDPYKECRKICGIDSKMARDWGLDAEKVLEQVLVLVGKCDCVMAANGNIFDRPMLETFSSGTLPDIPWIDITTDVPFPEDCRGRNLLYLCAYHGFLNPFPHRAMFDSMSMVKIMENYDMEEVLCVANSPILTFMANVGYHRRELAKNTGFRWDPDRKMWIFEVKEALLDYEWLVSLPFESKRVN